MTDVSARDEWRQFGLVPVAAGLGYATSVIHIYGIGPYIGPVAEAMGWSRTEVTFGLNWRQKGVPLIKNIKFGKKEMKLDNDVTIRIDFSMRDDATANSKLDQGTSFGTAGQKVIRIAPSIDYILTENLTLRFFYDRRISIPYVSNAFPITTTRGGVTFRFLLGN